MVVDKYGPIMDALKVCGRGRDQKLQPAALPLALPQITEGTPALAAAKQEGRSSTEQ